MNCNNLRWKVQAYAYALRVLCVVLVSSLLGVWGCSDSPFATSVGRESAELVALDVLAQPEEPVLLSARLVKTRLLMQTGLGGEPVDFLVSGESIGQTMTGGDGWARKEFIPRASGVLQLTVRLARGKRVKAESGTAVIGSVKRATPIVLVELEAAMTHVEKPTFGPFDLSALLSTHNGFPQPMPGASDALGVIAKRASLLYVLAGRTPQTSDAHAWLAEHAFPSGPVFMLQSGPQAFASKIEEWREDGWTNVRAGIGRNAVSAQAYVDLDLHAVMVLDEDDHDDVPEGVSVASDWNDLATMKALKFK